MNSKGDYIMARFCCCSLLVVLLLTFSHTKPLIAEEQYLSLEEALKLAVDNSPELEIARQQYAGSIGGVQQAKSRYLPHLSAGADFSRVNIDNQQPTDEDNVTTLLLDLNQLIYDFGKTSGLINAASFTRDAASAYLDQTLHDLIFDVKQAYYTVLEKQELIKVAEQAVANFDTQLYRAEKYLKAGVRTKIDVTNAQVNLSNEKLNLLQAEADLKRARVKLEQILGTKPFDGNYLPKSPVASLNGMINQAPATTDTLPDLLTAAQENRPGLTRYARLIDAAESRLTQVQGNYMPTLGVSGNYTDYETDLTGLYDQWQVGIGLSWELFSGFETQGQIAEAKASLREVSASYKLYDLAVVQEVTDSYYSADETYESVNIAGEALDLAAENLDLAEKRYKNGLGDLLEFNDAQLLYSQNRTRLVSAYFGYLTALARLERATGIIPEVESLTVE